MSDIVLDFSSLDGVAAHGSDYGPADHVSWLAVAVGDALQTASILGFMTTPHSGTLISGQPGTPVEWLIARRDAQPLLDLLETWLWT
ncbi:hypothetical protein E9228_000071 [Curtobacterium flaccumfaciens]|uniref:Uncharacterized protein n=1 Tax=Curtobacterium salicis TaxID=1779862 RepID=A0ABX0T1S6_9MICO|nr:hypothetical protein [Curtobacterium sp. WW7]NII39452.1 hypothetical protein [Curtobacterium sp. WW7]